MSWDTLGAALPADYPIPEDLIEHPTAGDGGGPRLVVGILGYGYAYSDDGGYTWTRSSAWNRGQYLPDDIAIDRVDGTVHDGRIYATANDGLAVGDREALLASDDGGATWTTLRHFPSGKAVVTVDRHGSVWVGTSRSGSWTGGVWRSEDGGATWADVTGNYSRAGVHWDILEGPDGRIYLAAGFSKLVSGGGVWRTVAPIAVASDAVPEPAGGFALSVAPNPTGRTAILRLAAAEAGDVRVGVYDLRGRQVAEVVAGPLAAGLHQWPIETAGWAAGVYVVRAAAGGQTATARLTVAR